MPRKYTPQIPNDVEPKTLERARQISAWFNEGLRNANLHEEGRITIQSLATKMKVNRGTLYILERGGQGYDGTFRRPTRETIKKIASALNLNAEEGLRIMGYDFDPNQARTLPDRITELSPEAAQVFAQFLSMVQEGELSKEAREIGKMYDSLPDTQKAEVEQNLRSLFHRFKGH